MRSRASMIACCAVLLAAALSGAGAARAATPNCESWTGSQPASPGSQQNQLFGAAVLSRCDAWAVGVFANGPVGQTLIEHFNGGAWTVAPSPDPGSQDDALLAVGAVSRTNIWAVGYYVGPASGRKTLILHWNGTSWKRLTSPNLGDESTLAGVRAISATNAWAVGWSELDNGRQEKTLIEHWDGRRWSRVASPSPARFSRLRAVAASSGANAWAVGSASSGGEVDHTLILHWNGRTWARAASPNLLLTSDLFGVATVSAASAWAVGSAAAGTSTQTLTLRWNGRRWSKVASPSPGTRGNDYLDAIAETPADRAWAVGGFTSTSEQRPLILDWTGRRWAQAAAASPGTISSGLFGIGAAADGIWAVGDFSTGGGLSQSLAVHCC